MEGVGAAGGGGGFGEGARSIDSLDMSGAGERERSEQLICILQFVG